MSMPEILSALRKRYAPPGAAFLEQVPSEVGGPERRMDALAMLVWRSRGLELHGFEIKISRSDWRRELCLPAKAEEIGRYMDRFWLVIADQAIVHDGELPPGWGLLAPGGRGLLRTAKPAPKLRPKPITRPFLASERPRPGRDGA
jgi:hypothetical protein